MKRKEEMCDAIGRVYVRVSEILKAEDTLVAASVPVMLVADIMSEAESEEEAREVLKEFSDKALIIYRIMLDGKKGNGKEE